MHLRLKINPKYSDISQYLFSIPKLFVSDTSASVMHENRNVVKYLPEKDIVVKRFIKVSLFNRLMYSFVRKSKAERSMLNAQKLLKLGIGTPEPVAFIEIRQNLIIRDLYYACRYCSWNKMDDVFYNKIDSDNVERANACVDFIVSIHKRGVLHFDLNPKNIFYKLDASGYNFKLIDLNRMAFHSGYHKRAALNNLTRMTEDKEIFEFIVKRYALSAGLNLESTLKQCLINRRRRENHYKIKRALK